MHLPVRLGNTIATHGHASTLRAWALDPVAEYTIAEYKSQDKFDDSRSRLHACLWYGN